MGHNLFVMTGPRSFYTDWAFLTYGMRLYIVVRRWMNACILGVDYLKKNDDFINMQRFVG